MQGAHAINNRYVLIVAASVTMRIMVTNPSGGMKRLVDIASVVDDKSECK